MGNGREEAVSKLNDEQATIDRQATAADALKAEKNGELFGRRNRPITQHSH